MLLPLMAIDTLCSPETGADAVAVTVTTVCAASLAVLVLSERLTVGVAPAAQGDGGLAVLRGLTVPAEKSSGLLSASVQPAAARETEVVLPGAGVGPLPSKQFAVAPKPTKSTRLPPVGHAPVSGVTVLERATLPAVPLMAVVPVASGAGRLVVPPVPAACCTR